MTAPVRTPLVGITVGIRRNMASTPYLLLRPTYTHAVALGGGAPVLIPLEIDDQALRRIYDQLDAVIISGGGDMNPDTYDANPSPYTMNVDDERDRVELQIIRWAVEEDKPLLAICRGIQVMNVALGGTLIQDIREEVDGALRHDAPADTWFPKIVHDVTVTADSKLYEALGIAERRLPVNSLHHQGVGKVAPKLVVTARADDGIVEGVELPDKRFAVGVQWHPEALVDDHAPMRQLFTSLVDAARL